jgi:hypothetical protein
VIASILALSLAAARTQTEAARPHVITPPQSVSALVAPVLNAYEAVALKDKETTEVPLHQALQKVLETRTGYGDEALAILLGYYVGEASAEDVSCELVSRGRYVLFYIDKYAKAESSIAGVRSYHARIFSEYPIVRRRIISEEVCHVEK